MVNKCYLCGSIVIVMEKDIIALNGNGHIVQGSNHIKEIVLLDRANITIESLVIIYFRRDMQLQLQVPT